MAKGQKDIDVLIAKKRRQLEQLQAQCHQIEVELDGLCSAQEAIGGAVAVKKSLVEMVEEINRRPVRGC